jgi:hypothetical protein
VGERAWLLAAVACAYATAFAGGFQFDDWNVVVNDPHVQSLDALRDAMPGIRPVLKLSFALNHASGLGLAGFHAVNVAIHAANALLVLALLRRLEARAAPAGGRARGAAPLLAALLFALHPAQTEAVTYVSGRSAALAATFALASALAFVAGRDGGRPDLARVLSPLLLACALGTKEVAAVLPAALLVVEATDVRRPFSWRAALRATAVHWAVLALAAAAFLASPVYRRMLAASLALRDPWTNALTRLRALAWLGGQVARPDLLDADPVLPVVARADAAVVLAAAALAGALAAGVLLARRRPAVAAAALWTVLWLDPAGWIVPRPEPANDRQLYLALVGPAWLAGRALAPWAAGGLGRVAVAALVVALAVATSARNLVYADEVRFWEAVLARSPANARAHNNLAVALAARCRVPEAEAALRRALELDRGYARAAVNLSLLRGGEPLGPDGRRCGSAR